MAANTFALVLSMSLSLSSTFLKTPIYIPVDIYFCDFKSVNSESICSIQEAENTSRNKILFDAQGKNPKLLIDKRNVISEKSKYIFSNEMITITKQSKIDMPYIDKSIIIEPGEYKIVNNGKGYIIAFTK